MVDDRSFDDLIMRVVFKYLLKGLKKQVENDEDTLDAGHKNQAFYLSNQYRRSCCMIIAKLCRKSVFAKAL
jgi:hypothetical protein